jgi:hypothetical protein
VKSKVEGLFVHLKKEGYRLFSVLVHDGKVLYIKRELDLNFSGNGVYYTACSLPVIFKNSCGEIHR